MKKADLHVHSKFSARPSEWFLQRLGARESYTEPEAIYAEAKTRGMDFVTLTDHNTIGGVMELKAHHPGDVITGVEATTYFPEDGCKIHLLVYGFTATQFIEIDRLRENIYELRDYLKQENLAHVVAHALFAVNKKLTEAHLEKLILLFDVFEAYNGGRTRRTNEVLHHFLESLTPAYIDEIRQRHPAITPFSDTPWIKGFTGGSDDHSGLFIARTCTTAEECSTANGFLDALREKRTQPDGRHTDYKAFAFGIYKIAYEFSKTKGSGLPASMLGMVNNLMFEGSVKGLRKRLSLGAFKFRKPKKGEELKNALNDLVKGFDKVKDLEPEERIAHVYDNVARITDLLLSRMVGGMGKNLGDGDLAGVIKNISGIIPVVFLSLPFLSAISLLNEMRELQDTLEARCGTRGSGRSKRILWFTDTLADLNGPSETIQKLGWLAHEHSLDLIPVTCLLPDEKERTLPPQVIDLPCIWTGTAAFFSLYTVRVPSILASIRRIFDEEPDEIVVSTPGPVGLLGVLAARLLHIPCRTIYHSDFSQQAAGIIGDEAMSAMVEGFMRWFYSMSSEVMVPTREYMRILGERGYDTTRMSLFPRGIENELFCPVPDAREHLCRQYGIAPEGMILLCAGRISREKNVDFLADVYRAIVQELPDVNLIFAGEGPEPYQSEFKAAFDGFDRVHFPGRIPRNRLPLLYSASDLLLFPSATDTFGMVVLEAQACGLPALVSPFGGPKEIIRDGITGYTVNLSVDEWVRCIQQVHEQASAFPEQRIEMRHAARMHVTRTYQWRFVLEKLFGKSAMNTAEENEPAFELQRDAVTA